MPATYEVIHGRCEEVLPTLPASHFDCVISDPLYPMISRSYGMMTEADWLPMMQTVVLECRRVLKPRGSAVFILQPNSERVGRTRTWLWEFMVWAGKSLGEWGIVQDVWWWNVAAMPGENSGLLRPSLKACVWIGAPDCYRAQDAVLWTESESNASLRTTARCGRTVFPSGHSINEKAISLAAVRRGGVTPFNVLPIPNTDSTSSAGAAGHGAGTPLPLADWWTRYLCPPGGVVLDPFFGSGTTGVAALRRGCSVVGVEKEASYVRISEERCRRAAAQTVLDFTTTEETAA